MLLVMIFSLLGTLNSSYISTVSLISVYTQEINKSKYDWSLNFVKFEDAKSIDDARTKLRKFETELNFVTRGDFASFLVCGDETTKFEIFNSDMQEIKSIANLSLDEVCRYNDSFGFLYGFPAEPMFNNGPCDWNLFPNPQKKSSSYITSSIADRLISLQPDKYKNGYKDLIGESYYLKNKDSLREYTINNIVNVKKNYGNVFNDFFGDFIISADKELFNEYECSISITFMSDFVALNDFVVTLQKENITRSSMFLKNDNSWLETNSSKRISEIILKKNRIGFKPFEIVLLCMSLVSFCLLVLVNVLILKGNLTKILRIELLCSSILFATVGMINIFGKTNYFINTIFNFVVCIGITAIFIYLVIINGVTLFKTRKDSSCEERNWQR